METISFVYNSTTYKARVRITSVQEPRYYWCYLNDMNLSHKIGNCIVFTRGKDALNPLYYYPIEYRPLIDSVKEAILQQCAMPV